MKNKKVQELNDTDKKILYMVEYALKESIPNLLFGLSSLLEKRAHFEDKLKDLLLALPPRSDN